MSVEADDNIMEEEQRDESQPIRVNVVESTLEADNNDKFNYNFCGFTSDMEP